MYCRNCGASIDENAAICVKCGFEKGLGSDYCFHCGEKVEKNQTVCMACGYAIPKEKQSISKTLGSKKGIIAIAAIVLIAIIGIVAATPKTNNAKEINFEEIYTECGCISTWAEVADDGTYLFIDTNPYDWDDDGLAYPEAYNAIEEINKKLGIPSSLMKDIGSTNSLDGKQVRTYEEIGIEVKWKYHPDHGLELTYSKIK